MISADPNLIKPGFSFTREGQWQSSPQERQRNVTGRVISWKTDAPQRFTIAYRVEFSSVEDATNGAPLGIRRDTVVYEAGKSGEFNSVPRLSTASQPDIEYFYEFAEPWGPQERCGQFLAFNFLALAKVAALSGPGKMWLSRFLPRCPGTPESKRLKAILNRPR